MIALEIVLSRFLAISTSYFKISLAFLPVVLAGMLYGPWWGGAAAAAADLIGALLFPIGPYFPGFTLTAFLRGMTYGLFFYRRNFRMSRVNAAVAIVCILLQFGADTYWLYLIMGSGVAAYIPTRALTNGVLLVVQAVVISVVFRVGQPAIRKVYGEQLDLYRKKALQLFPGDGTLRRTVSDGIVARVQTLSEYQQAATVFCFVGTLREIDTEPILRDALSSGKRVCVPRCEADSVMTAREIRSLDDLRSTGSFGIREPDADTAVVPPEEIGLALIPCSAADLRGNRIGKGGGYYDRYLADTAMVKLTLCPEALLQRKLWPQPYDIATDLVVTERRLLKR